MMTRLRENMLYSEKRARDMLFDAIQHIATFQDLHTPLTLSQLTRASVNRARAVAREQNYEFAVWDLASKAVANAILHAGALLDQQGNQVMPGLSAQATPIGGLRRGFRDLTEAYLIEFLITELGDISIRDHKALAHVLFRQFDRTIPMEEFEDRVVTLLATLGDRVILRKDGVYSVKRPS